jgi:hypothetical protein
VQHVWIWPLILSFTGLLSFAPEIAQAACTVPDQLSNGQTADATQVMANFNAMAGCVNNAPAGSTNALQYNAGSGAFGSVGPLTNGQVLIGSTGNAPQAAQLSAGTGIAITNGPGSIMISGASSPYSPPKLANFTWVNQPTGATAGDSNTGLAMYSPAHGGDDLTSLQWNGTFPSSPYSVTIGVLPTLMGQYLSASIWIGDGSGKNVNFGIIFDPGGGNGTRPYIYNFSGNVGSSAVFDLGYPDPNIRFLQVQDNGTNFTLLAGADLNSLVKLYTVSRTAFLSAPSELGIAINPNSSTYDVSATFFHFAVTSQSVEK